MKKVNTVTVNEIMDYEMGVMEGDDVVEFFQKLIDTGMAWALQGHYGRTAKVLIDAGHCVLETSSGE